jgi:uncharacterized C2H2 Zn-finger protein
MTAPEVKRCPRCGQVYPYAARGTTRPARAT